MERPLDYSLQTSHREHHNVWHRDLSCTTGDYVSTSNYGTSGAIVGMKNTVGISTHLL